ncbi:hypothetical protein F0562_000722 [Nyssa sinensis]|uniref:3'-5' exonuclease domain-containing protein n=1 Tax=Nyssa sinensis TaxID=561372 RepID=A0A5J5C195_9ASTE|nr:hypothetical protein F0562_000722 [Nyssa sinensis]
MEITLEKSRGLGLQLQLRRLHSLCRKPPHPDHPHLLQLHCYQMAQRDSRVIAVGMDMFNVAKKLDRDYQIKIRNPIDLNCMAVKGLRRDDLDLGRYDLDRLATTVLGKHVDVIRPENKVEWYDRRFFRYDRLLTLEKVKYATVDPYLCFLIGSELLDVIGPERLHLIDASASVEKKKKKKQKTKKKKKTG